MFVRIYISSKCFSIVYHKYKIYFLHYSLTAPEVNPATILLWKIKTNITIGIVTIIVAA